TIMPVLYMSDKILQSLGAGFVESQRLFTDGARRGESYAKTEALGSHGHSGRASDSAGSGEQELGALTPDPGSCAEMGPGRAESGLQPRSDGRHALVMAAFGSDGQHLDLGGGPALRLFRIPVSHRHPRAHATLRPFALSWRHTFQRLRSHLTGC